MRKYLAGATIALVVIGLAAGTYYLGTQGLLFKESPKIPKVVKELETVKPSPTINPPPSTVNVSEQVAAAITSKNTQALEGYMADIVQVRLEASGCCGPITKAEAMSQLSYLDPAVGWSFDPANPVIVDLAINSPDYYGTGWLVGVASNEYIVSFKINNLNKIEAYNLGASYKLLIP
jgi:hypothetical protein